MLLNFTFAFVFICLFLGIVAAIFIYVNQPKKKHQIPYELNKNIGNGYNHNSSNYKNEESSIKDRFNQNSTSKTNNNKSIKSPKAMRVIVKIILTIVAFIVATFLIGALKSITGNDSTGVLGLVIGAGLIGGIIAIWRYNPKPEENNQIDKHQLNKD